VEAAIERYDQTVELKPDFAEAWNNLGVALSESGRREESRIAFEHAISANPPSLRLTTTSRIYSTRQERW
jgi:superkiller protein 3